MYFLILIKFEDLTAQLVAFHGNLAPAPSGQIHHASHDTVSHLVVQPFVLFLHILPKLCLTCQMLLSAGTDQQYRGYGCNDLQIIVHILMESFIL